MITIWIVCGGRNWSNSCDRYQEQEHKRRRRRKQDYFPAEGGGHVEPKTAFADSEKGTSLPSWSKTSQISAPTARRRPERSRRLKGEAPLACRPEAASTDNLEYYLLKGLMAHHGIEPKPGVFLFRGRFRRVTTSSHLPKNLGGDRFLAKHGSCEPPLS